MKKNRRYLALILSMILIASVLSACNGSIGAAAPAGTQNNADTVITEAPDSAEEAVVEITAEAKDDTLPEVINEEIPAALEDEEIQPLERASLLNGLLKDEYEEEALSFTPYPETAAVQYRLEDTINKEYFDYLDEEVKALLEKNGFAVAQSYSYEFYQQYEDNRYDLTPNFITVDSLMHTYHLYFSHLLKNTEKEYLYDELYSLTGEMLQKSLDQYGILKGTEWDTSAGKTVVYFAVASELLGLEPEIPEELTPAFQSEVKLIKEQAGIASSPLLGIYEDYSQYKPRGYYDTDEELSRYFQSLMWYGRMNFSQKEEEMDRTALLILLLMDEETLPQWEHIYAVTRFFAGESDDAGYYEYRPVIDMVYGENTAAEDLIGRDDLWQKYHDLTKKITPPSINSVPVFDDSIDEDRDSEITGFRFMGQRFTLDASIFQSLIYRSVGENKEGNRRMLPDPLDIPAALGNEAALGILEENKAFTYENYPENMDKLRKNIKEKDKSFWNLSLYNGWLYTLLPLLDESREGYPAFMQTNAWTRKNLMSFLGSWAELKHDTILYGKQAMAEMGGGWEEERDDRGYVEPEPVVYARLAALSDATRDGLEEFGFLSMEDTDSLERLSSLARKLQIIAQKELIGEIPTDEEFELIRTYGGQLEHFWYEAIKDQADGRQYVRAEEFPSAVIADVATDPNGTCLEVGTGKPARIYVIVEVDGSPRIAVGSVFTFYSFEQPLSERLTDSEWRIMMGVTWTDNWVNSPYENADPVDPPAWTEDFLITYDWY